MNIDYDPWGESHAPQRFERQDPTGRWLPIQDELHNEPFWFSVVGAIVTAAFFAFMLWGIR